MRRRLKSFPVGEEDRPKRTVSRGGPSAMETGINAPPIGRSYDGVIIDDPGKPAGPFFRARYLATGSGERFSKRAFFFSLFAFVAFVYIIVCAAGVTMFDDRLGLFIIACNAAFGLNYYGNERGKSRSVPEKVPWHITIP